MPFPLTFLIEKNFRYPTYPNPVPGGTTLSLSLHYAIKGAEYPSAETVFPTFNHVTEGTLAGYFGLKLTPGAEARLLSIPGGTAEAVPFPKPLLLKPAFPQHCFHKLCAC